MKLRIPFLQISLLFVLAVLLASCSTTPAVRPSADIVSTSTLEPFVMPELVRQDIYHAVAPGETLWRISQMYDVDVATIKRINRIRDVRDLSIGQRLYIPEAGPRIEMVTLYPSRKWRYIVIHHSATDNGSSETFDKAHKGRGWGGVGYHFVIDNGTYGKDDGQIESTPRWIKQMDGAHCKANKMNKKSIGICLVGNFSIDRTSPRQMRSLVYLVKQLKKYYRIPTSRILGHSQVPGARTECPGRRFPWKTFHALLRK